MKRNEGKQPFSTGSLIGHWFIDCEALAKEYRGQEDPEKGNEFFQKRCEREREKKRKLLKGAVLTTWLSPDDVVLGKYNFRKKSFPVEVAGRIADVHFAPGGFDCTKVNSQSTKEDGEHIERPRCTWRETRQSTDQGEGGEGAKKSIIKYLFIFQRGAKGRKNK